jgi:hypothetical protein
MRVPIPAVVLLGVALAGCGRGDRLSQADKVKPELPRVTLEVRGMS